MDAVRQAEESQQEFRQRVERLQNTAS